MNEDQKAIARSCLAGTEANTITFPEIVGALMEARVESYAVDLRRATATYYLADGESIELPGHRVAPPSRRRSMPRSFRRRSGKRDKAASAGCAGNILPFPGHRALYFGRTAVTHVEHFPDQ